MWGLVDKGLHKPKVLLTVKTCSNIFSFFLVVPARFQGGKNTKNCCIPCFKRRSNRGGNIGARLQALNIKGHNIMTKVAYHMWRVPQLFCTSSLKGQNAIDGHWKLQNYGLQVCAEQFALCGCAEIYGKRRQ